MVQNIIEKEGKAIVGVIYEELKGRIFDLSIHKFASNVLEKSLVFGDVKTKKTIVEEVINKDEVSKYVIK